jgi:hypothetical protein
MVQQEKGDLSAEIPEPVEISVVNGDNRVQEPSNRWEGYSLSILAVFFENS